MSFRDRTPSPPPLPTRRTYSACVGADLIDTSEDAAALVRFIIQNWPEHSGEDVAIWEGEPGSGYCRLVAYLKDDPAEGGFVGTWI